jgi:hypothetical protein
MAKAKLKTVPPTKADVISDLMDYSRCGAMTQIFIVDALTRDKDGYKPTPAHRPREDNAALVRRLLKADAMRDATDVVDIVTAHAVQIAGAGLEAVRKAFGENSFIHPDAWFHTAVEVRDKLLAVDLADPFGKDPHTI